MKIETTSKPNQAYCTEEYGKLGLPIAPAIIVGDDLVVQGSDVDEEKVEAVIPPPFWPACKELIFGRFLGR